MPVFILLISSLLAAADWNPVESEPKIVKNTLMDFSMTQVSPAGQYGFVQAAPDGELYFEKKPDQKIRFYGGNITFGVNFPDKEQAVKLADLFAAMGYNVIRFHHHDTVVPWSKSLYEISGDRISFIPDQADRFDYLLSELRKRGIYYFSDVICSSLIDKHPAFAKYGNNSKARKFLYHLTPEGRSLFLQIATLFLTHVNPYTGLAYKDDPALILLGLVNEDSPVNLTGADKDEFSPELMNYVLGEFNAFILKKYHAEPAAEFHQGKFGNEKQPYAGYWADFYFETYMNFYNSGRSLYKKLGYRGLVSGVNYTETPYLNALRSAMLDVYENHMYITHDVKTHGGQQAFNPQTRKMFTSQLAVPKSQMFRLTEVFSRGASRLDNYFPRIALGQIFEKPLLFTEYNHVFPCPAGEQMSLLAGAYAAFWGWDSLNAFSYSGWPENIIDKQPMGDHWFRISQNPPRVLMEYMGRMLFLENRLTQSRPRFLFVRDMDFCRTSGNLWGPEHGPSFKSLIYIPHLFNCQTVFVKNSDIFSVYRIPDGLAAAALASGNIPAVYKLSLPAEADCETYARFFIEASDSGYKQEQLTMLGQKKLLSDTGEILFDVGSERFIINAPTVAAVSGNAAGLDWNNRIVRIKADLPHLTFFIASLDRKPLSASRKMIIFFITEVRSTGDQFADLDDKTIVYTKGDLPILAAYGELDFALANNQGNFILAAHHINGPEIDKLAVTCTDGIVKSRLSTARSFVFSLTAK